MRKMSAQIEHIVNAYKTVAKVPAIFGGKLSNCGQSVTAKWSTRNLDKGRHTKYSYNYRLDEAFHVVSESEFASDISNELLSSVSPTETFRAVIREEKDGKDKKQFLEVWTKNTLEHSVDLTALELHGDVYADSEFAALEWSQDECSIVYIAEKKRKKSEPYIKRKSEDKCKPDGSGESSPKKGEEYVFREDWGEQLVGKQLSVIVVCDIQTETFTVLEGLPDSWCPGQVRFVPSGRSVVGVAWETEPSRLGLMFCTNRPSYIFELSLDGSMKTISEEGMAVRGPRITPSGHIVWLQREATGPHHACHALCISDTTQIRTIIDIVPTKVSITSGEPFYGLYCTGLPARCFASDNRILFSTPQQTAVRSYVANLDGSRVVEISNKRFDCSTTILDVYNDVVLATCSNMATPTQLWIARLPPPGQEQCIEWVPVSEPRKVPSCIENATYKRLDLTHNNQDSVASFTAMYFAPAVESNQKLPLIVWPHGGPHVSFINSYSFDAAFFCMLGFASLQINYRGSTGAGQACVEYLCKRIGDADVKDCKYATDVAISQFPQVDKNQVVLFGGSHGGFLVTQLSGQYPDFYKVVVSRNPVTDLASMYNSTDIMDWCYVEAGFPYSEKGPVKEEEMIAMRRCSPIVHAHKVRAPTCLMLGSGDLRVPKFQGLHYARVLKANGVPVRVQMFDDNHSLSSSLLHEMDNNINAALWFFEHLQKS